MHAAVVFFIFGQSKAQAVTRSQVADDLLQPRSVVPGAIDPQGLAAGLLREVFGAAVETDTEPAGHWFPDRHKKLEQRAQIGGERTERRI
jgi:hypothetical protein